MEPRITDKRTIAERFGNKELMNKRPVKNDKYKNVSTVVDTGKTIKDVQFISDQLVSKRKSELFKRIKCSTIIKLLNQNPQTESIYNLGNEPEMLNPNDEKSSVVSVKTTNSAMSHQTSITAVTYATEMLGNLAEIDFVILDLREECEYQNYHIKESLSYPGVFISRDKFLSQMIMMKNKESKMIIVYHTDERSGVPYAGLLFQKGYDNIYFLSGGIEEFCKRFPEYLEGPQRETFINMKKEKEKQEHELMLKKTGQTKSKYHYCGKEANKNPNINNNNNISNKKITSNNNNKFNNSNQIDLLKQNLANK